MNADDEKKTARISVTLLFHTHFAGVQFLNDAVLEIPVVIEYRYVIDDVIA